MEMLMIMIMKMTLVKKREKLKGAKAIHSNLTINLYIYYTLKFII